MQRHLDLLHLSETEINALHEEMMELASDLHIPLMHQRIMVETISASSGQRTKHIDRFSRSLTRNAYNIWYKYFVPFREGTTYADGSLEAKRTSGVITQADSISVGRQNLLTTGIGYVYPATSSSGGIIVGTGTTAESFDDFVVESLISHGAGGGQLEYAAMGAAVSEGWDAGNNYYYAQYDRDMVNNSGAQITVYEFCQYWGSNNPGSYTYMMSRDVEAGGVAVPNGDTLTVSYENRVTFP